MLSFENDYSEGAHPAILRRLAETNMEQITGYGMDHYCESAKARIREACGCPDAEIWFLVGGTQTNMTVIDTITPPYAGVVAAESGHVNVHEAGAIEATGHKVLTLPQHDGRIDADELRDYIATFYADDNHEHMVFPGSVYVSQCTEYGTIYTKAELEAIADVCHEYEIPLFVDGARLGYALTATGNDVTLKDLARIADVFYIGGTKVGALFGEAVVFPRGNAPRHFLTLVKQHGALLAKGWLLGLQFDTLFTDDLYTRIARNANEAAERIRTALREKGYRFAFEAPTNQIFIVLDQPTIDRLSTHVRLGFMEKYDDDHSVMRICTSWATTPGHVDELIALL
ncbi:aminotransferase class I/II-fold pyridoxal phosphate-dependent enzyme [Bifidobacterium callimiconis]|uniref:threonine aldolase family protein n=1 Tax=Bifidobacterium callimiconis TaxID=2306973 RepID=UPI001BDC1EB7|nr:aminotransferase class I/II-fold pyridoxal phosphate-dependent enzyme [Bifidobacterium callimiconis]MBT1177050.1 aminotransferase class I/II-fold pyridoxal phosphate-dependent enzyme [Bifidobacterium callimiconis]